MRLEIGKTYESGGGNRAYIMGHIREDNGAPSESVWSLQGNHYSADGRMWSFSPKWGRFLLPAESHHTLVREIETYELHIGLAEEWADKQKRRIR